LRLNITNNVRVWRKHTKYNVNIGRCFYGLTCCMIFFWKLIERVSEHNYSWFVSKCISIGILNSLVRTYAVYFVPNPFKIRITIVFWVTRVIWSEAICIISYHSRRWTERGKSVVQNKIKKCILRVDRKRTSTYFECGRIK